MIDLNTVGRPPGRPPGGGKGKTPLFSLRLDKDVVARIADVAAKNGETSAGYVRRLIFQALKEVDSAK